MSEVTTVVVVVFSDLVIVARDTVRSLRDGSADRQGLAARAHVCVPAPLLRRTLSGL
jgi:hypothetical protein